MSAPHVKASSTKRCFTPNQIEDLAGKNPLFYPQPTLQAPWHASGNNHIQCPFIFNFFLLNTLDFSAARSALNCFWYFWGLLHDRFEAAEPWLLWNHVSTATMGVWHYSVETPAVFARIHRGEIGDPERIKYQIHVEEQKAAFWLLINHFSCTYFIYVKYTIPQHDNQTIQHLNICNK